MGVVEKKIKEIKSLKIQGATAVARASLQALGEFGKDQNFPNLQKAARKLGAARPTEPLARNCLAYVLWQVKRGKSLPTAVDLMLARLADIETEIVNHGVKLIKPDMKILTHCHSSTVVRILKIARQQKINFSVYLTETRPKFQGRITAKKLTQIGIEAIMITDSAAAYTLSHLDKIEIDLVLVGADAIAIDGSCLNKIGSYALALASQEAKIPFYIASSLLKFDAAGKTASEIKIEERSPGEVWQNRPKNLRIINPAFDPVPVGKITAYVTEFGLMKPGAIKKQIAKNYYWITSKPKTQSASWRTKLKIKKEFSYLYLGEKFDQHEHIMAVFRVEPTSEIAAEQVAAESSIGTWTRITHQTKERFQRLAAKVFENNPQTKIIKIAYPLALFEPGNIPQLLSSVAGNVFGMKAINNLRLLDLELPEKYVQSFPGPSFGLAGVRKFLGVKNRPILASIIKPKEGLTAKEHAALTGQLFRAGIDLVKDDENLTSPQFNPFDQRLVLVMKEIQQLKKPKLYAFNITAPYELMIRRAQRAKNARSQCVMVDIFTVGFSAVQSLRRRFPDLVIHGHRAMHASLTRNQKHGITMLVLAKLARLAGVDQLHTGTVIGKMEGEKKEVLAINKFLRREWFGLKPVLPVASGGLYPDLIPKLIKILGQDTIFAFGGGIHGHSGGAFAGAQAVVQAARKTKGK